MSGGEPLSFEEFRKNPPPEYRGLPDSEMATAYGGYLVLHSLQYNPSAVVGLLKSAEPSVREAAQNYLSRDVMQYPYEQFIEDLGTAGFGFSQERNDELRKLPPPAGIFRALGYILNGFKYDELSLDDRRKELEADRKAVHEEADEAHRAEQRTNERWKNMVAAGDSLLRELHNEGLIPDDVFNNVPEAPGPYVAHVIAALRTAAAARKRK